MRSVPRSVADPLGANDHNVNGTLQRAGGGAAGRRAAGGVRLVVVGVRRPARAAQARGPAAGADLALRGVQGGRRAVRRGVAPPLRRGDGRAALLQRVRPAPGPDLRVRGGHPALHPVGAGAAPRSRSTATASSRATSPTSTTSWRPTAWPPRRRASAGQVFNVGCGERVSLLADRRAPGGAARPRGRAAPRAAAGRRRAAHAGRHRPRQAPARLHPARALRRGAAPHAGLLQEDRHDRPNHHGAAGRHPAPSPLASGVALAPRARRTSSCRRRSSRPGLDLTATPASATAGVRPLQRAGVPGEGRPHRQDRAVAGRALAHLATTRTTRSSSARACASTTAAS